MKKTIIAAMLCFFGLTQMHSQVTFSPGFRGGANFSHLTHSHIHNIYDETIQDYVREESNYETKTDFYLGFYGALKLAKFYTLQPEMNYSRQGAIATRPGYPDKELNLSYVSMGLANKFTYSGFNFHVGTTLDFIVEDNFNPDSEVDMTVFMGFGYNFTKNFGIEARVKKGIIPVLDYSEDDHTNVVFQTGLTYTFDVK